MYRYCSPAAPPAAGAGPVAGHTLCATSLAITGQIASLIRGVQRWTFNCSEKDSSRGTDPGGGRFLTTFRAGPRV